MSVIDVEYEELYEVNIQERNHHHNRHPRRHHHRQNHNHHKYQPQSYRTHVHPTIHNKLSNCTNSCLYLSTGLLCSDVLSNVLILMFVCLFYTACCMPKRKHKIKEIIVTEPKIKIFEQKEEQKEFTSVTSV